MCVLPTRERRACDDRRPSVAVPWVLPTHASMAPRHLVAALHCNSATSAAVTAFGRRYGITATTFAPRLGAIAPDYQRLWRWESAAFDLSRGYSQKSHAGPRPSTRDSAPSSALVQPRDAREVWPAHKRPALRWPGAPPAQSPALYSPQPTLPARDDTAQPSAPPCANQALWYSPPQHLLSTSSALECAPCTLRMHHPFSLLPL